MTDGKRKHYWQYRQENWLKEECINKSNASITNNNDEGTLKILLLEQMEAVEQATK